MEEEIECTICAEIIPNYEPEYFDGIEINPACDSCNPSSTETEKQLDDLCNGVTANDTVANDDLNRKTEEEKARREIRSRVRAKLETRFRNGEISRDAIPDLEEELVNELEQELLAEADEECDRREEIT